MTTSNTGSDFSGWGDTHSDIDSEVEYGLEPNVDDVSREEARHRDQDNLQGTKRQVGGAAVAAGLAGAILVGPVVGLVAAGGAAVVATTKGSAGNVARAAGDVTANAGERLRKFDKKHQVTSKASKGFVKGAKWVSNKIKVKDRNGAGDNLTA